jgi:hypothetical protein
MRFGKQGVGHFHRQKLAGLQHFDAVAHFSCDEEKGGKFFGFDNARDLNGETDGVVPCGFTRGGEARKQPWKVLQSWSMWRKASGGWGSKVRLSCNGAPFGKNAPGRFFAAARALRGRVAILGSGTGLQPAGSLSF